MRLNGQVNGRVYSEQEKDRTGQKLLFDLDGISHKFKDYIGMWPLLEVVEEQTCKIGMHAFISTDELVGESQTRHEAALLQPEY